MTAREYNNQVHDMTNKFRASISNFRKMGFKFVGYGDEDVLQEIQMHLLRIQKKYDPKRAKLNTFLYKCMRMYVYGLEKQLNKKRLFLYNDIYGNNDDEKTNCEIDEIIGNTRDLERMKLKDSIFGLMDFLKGYCNITGAYMVFKSLMENGGDRKGTCAELGITAGRVSQIVKEIRSTGYYVREFLN